jgi:hypothetical protein
MVPAIAKISMTRQIVPSLISGAYLPVFPASMLRDMLPFLLEHGFRLYSVRRRTGSFSHIPHIPYCFSRTFHKRVDFHHISLFDVCTSSNL